VTFSVGITRNDPAPSQPDTVARVDLGITSLAVLSTVRSSPTHSTCRSPNGSRVACSANVSAVAVIREGWIGGRSVPGRYGCSGPAGPNLLIGFVLSAGSTVRVLRAPWRRPDSKGRKMNHEQFVSSVAEHAGVDPEQAEALTRAVLATLAERITGGEARDLAAQLPVPLQNPLLSADEEAEAFSLDEFIRRTAQRAGTDRDTADIGVAAVMTTLRESISSGEFDDVMSQLPQEFRGVAEIRG